MNGWMVGRVDGQMGAGGVRTPGHLVKRGDSFSLQVWGREVGMKQRQCVNSQMLLPYLAVLLFLICILTLSKEGCD